MLAESLLIIIVLRPLAITGVLGLAAVVLVHEVAEVIVVANGLRTARTRRHTAAEQAPHITARLTAPTAA
ncbi:HAD family hydrolase [Microbacterium resistens]